MKILTLGLGAFGFAINKLIWENNLKQAYAKSLWQEEVKIYAYEINKDVVNKIKTTREHPFFFSGYKLPKNIEIIDNYDEIIWKIDLLIIAIPTQFISQTIKNIQNKLKSGVVILNLAKWIDIKSNKTISQLIAINLKWINYLNNKKDLY